MINELTFERVLGKGGMGVVWHATHPTMGEVAAKFVLVRSGLEETITRALKTEVRAIARMHHSGIVNILSSGSTPEAVARDVMVESGSPYMLMEYVPGVEFDRAFPTPTAQYWNHVFQLLEALSHVHARGVIHRDLKPGNVLITPDHRTLLLDLGVAQIFERNSKLSTEGVASGTPRYMSPEQILGHVRDQGPWSDLYALGCIVFRSLTGRSPYDGDSFQMMEKHVQAPIPDLPSHCSVELNSWVRKCLAKEPTQRYAFAAHALRDLKGMLLPAVASQGGGAWPLETPDEADTIQVSLEPTHRFAVPPAAPPESGSFEIAELDTDLSDWRSTASEPGQVIWSPDLFPMREFPLAGMEVERDKLWHETRRALDASPRVVGFGDRDIEGASVLVNWLARASHEVGAALALEIEYNQPAVPGDGIAAGLSRLFKCQGLPYQRRITRLRGHRLLMDRGLENEELRALSEQLADVMVGVGESVVNVLAPAAEIALLIRTLEVVSSKQPIIVTARNPDHAYAFKPWVEGLKRTSASVLVLVHGRAQSIAVDRMIALSEPSQEEAVRVIRSEFGLSEDAAKALVRQGTGSRFLMRQLLDDWVDRGQLVPSKSGMAFRGAEPAAAQDTWLRRYGRAIEDSSWGWSTAAVVALLGLRSSVEDYESVCGELGLSRPDLLLDPLRDVGLIRVADGVLEWTHPILHDSYVQHAKSNTNYLEIVGACVKTLSASLRYESKLRAADLLVELNCHSEAFELFVEAGHIAEFVDPVGALARISKRLNGLAIGLPVEVRPECIAWSLLWRSTTARKQGRSEQARELAKLSIGEATKAGGEVCAHAWLQVAITIQAVSAQEAIEAYGHCLEISQDRKLRLMAVYGIAWAQIEIGALYEAQTTLEAYDSQAEEFAIEDPVFGARWHKCWALLELRTERYARAETRLLQALQAADAPGSGRLRTGLLTDLGEVRRAMGDPDRAILYYRQAMTSSVLVSDRECAVAQANIAMTKIQIGQWESAENELSQIQSLPFIAYLIDVMWAVVEAQKGNPDRLLPLLSAPELNSYLRNDVVDVLECVVPFLDGDLKSRVEATVSDHRLKS